MTGGVTHPPKHALFHIHSHKLVFSLNGGKTNLQRKRKKMGVKKRRTKSWWRKERNKRERESKRENILHVQRGIPNNACRAELGRYPLIIKIQKRAIKFYNHLTGSDSHTFHNKAITYREMNLEKRSLSKLVLGLCSQTQTHPTEP